MLSESLETTFVEVPCQRAVADDEFPRGIQDYNWSISNPTVWYPSKSYYRVDVEVLGSGDPTLNPRPKLSDQIALAEGCVQNAFTNAYFMAGGQVVSSLVNFSGQCGAVSQRTRAYPFKASGVHGSLTDRIAALALGEGPVGVSGLDDHREEIYKPVATSAAATLAVSAAVGAPVDTAALVVELNTNRTLVSDTTASGLATAFADGTVDAGVKIVIGGGGTYTIVSVATAGNGIQTITAKGPFRAAVAATADWYAVRRNTQRAQESHSRQHVIYKPPLGIFDYEMPMGAGQYKMSLSPDPSYRLTMVESKVPDFAAAGAASRYTVKIKDIKFYAAIAKLSIPDSIVSLDLAEWSAQAKTMNGKSANLQFTIPQSTEIIYIALQGPAAGSNPAFPPSKFVGVLNSDLNLDQLQVTYGSQTLPQTRWTSEFAGSVNHLRQFYSNTLCSIMKNEHDSGVESFNEWLSRGPIYAFRFDRAADARDTELNVQVTYKDSSQGVFDNNSKLFVLCEYRKLTKITHSAGSITQVISLNA